MSSISSITSNLASSLFSRLDTKNQGYIEKSDLATALSSLSSTDSSSTASAEEVFSALDADSDGKVTESELASSLQSLADELDSQYNSSRMNEAMNAAGGMPPPPPPSDSTSSSSDDDGFTVDELTAQLDEIGSSDSKRSDLISNIVANFDEADTNGDGKVTRSEAMAFDQSSSTSSSTATSSTTSTSDSGFTLDELTAQLDEIGTSDSKRSDLISNIVANFDKADTNGDGKVSNQEAMAYEQANGTSSTNSVAATGSSSDSGSTSTSTSNEDFAVMLRIMQLAESYGSSGSSNQTSTLLSTLA